MTEKQIAALEKKRKPLEDKIKKLLNDFEKEEGITFASIEFTREKKKTKKKKKLKVKQKIKNVRIPIYLT